jgi:hypothetical protein
MELSMGSLAVGAAILLNRFVSFFYVPFKKPRTLLADAISAFSLHQSYAKQKYLLSLALAYPTILTIITVSKNSQHWALLILPLLSLWCSVFISTWACRINDSSMRNQFVLLNTLQAGSSLKFPKIDDLICVVCKRHDCA